MKLKTYDDEIIDVDLPESGLIKNMLELYPDCDEIEVPFSYKKVSEMLKSYKIRNYYLKYMKIYEFLDIMKPEDVYKHIVRYDEYKQLVAHQEYALEISKISDIGIVRNFVNTILCIILPFNQLPKTDLVRSVRIIYDILSEKDPDPIELNDFLSEHEIVCIPKTNLVRKLKAAGKIPEYVSLSGSIEYAEDPVIAIEYFIKKMK